MSISRTASAGVEPELREPTREGGAHDSTKDSVHYLPGKITISEARRLQSLRRRSLGASILHRFMVRGHWRHPNPSWKDQRLRWIEPYWKGPDLASVIERQYQLTHD